MRPRTASNGLRYAFLGDGVGSGKPAATHVSEEALLRLVNAVPASLAAALTRTTYVFVPLALSGARLRGNDAADAAFQSNDPTLVALHATPELVERAICHRNAEIRGEDLVFLSALLHNDSFALAFEFFINIAHDLVDIASMPASFGDLLAEQTAAGVRGETSIDAWEHRVAAFGPQPDTADTPSRTRPAPRPSAPPPTPAAAEQARRDYRNAAFADAVAIYLLSIFLDFDYADLREREYPLLAPPALAARLCAVHALYPPNPGYQFQILYRRRA
ncbi:hypothetical protein [Terriglobus aquaticus]|uniref:Uncharacterized protein n=1 Tax=Terriglobus aquaticus TaxID=940139 RepID=A0ABW9KFX5_9BACT|nr:hypothetical protein [Terriglobus aquaticus]